ncbi:unnamed protein product [Onchocerca flexuosa]|uniref:Plastocyanin-like domain-containing protein n=1 Tax=Onchocerca flexuosa TaxID=387005 RepID=A0A183HZL2_9BILA|nr:unnamed protein product [Onchocerca flexuosa]
MGTGWRRTCETFCCDGWLVDVMAKNLRNVFPALLSPPSQSEKLNSKCDNDARISISPLSTYYQHFSSIVIVRAGGLYVIVNFTTTYSHHSSKLYNDMWGVCLGGTYDQRFLTSLPFSSPLESTSDIDRVNTKYIDGILFWSVVKAKMQ